jgi:hypothetical protein
LIAGEPIRRSSSFTVAGRLVLSDEGRLQILTSDSKWNLSINGISNIIHHDYLDEIVSENSIPFRHIAKSVRSLVHLYKIQLVHQDGGAVFRLGGVKRPRLSPYGDNPFCALDDANDVDMEERELDRYSEAEKKYLERDAQKKEEFKERSKAHAEERENRGDLSTEDMQIILARLEAGSRTKPHAYNQKHGFANGIKKVFPESSITLIPTSAKVLKEKEEEFVAAATPRMTRRPRVETPEHQTAVAKNRLVKQVESIDELIDGETLALRFGQFFLSACNVYELALQQCIEFADTTNEAVNNVVFDARAEKRSDNQHDVFFIFINIVV